MSTAGGHFANRLAKSAPIAIVLLPLAIRNSVSASERVKPAAVNSATSVSDTLGGSDSEALDEAALSARA